ncbi:leucyl/phenylalanyl-tRNA--protein transferase [Catalinimonas alkaloidigena]|uniref:leucyl/phenylalanyl-tRNA--protein transferase n=1 Tax=Catalinimonas alkaloidigena TaxID=1075417 RepID=UPI002406B667|nr:leucyl/phenylalanyl-tRNA--protein transferase [Catalinimonas alkaloidigena]MDF9798660.1 leucyl/phenylalanyl-tRNA--protein transferase [Catalinimonas alkaloidigena]
MLYWLGNELCFPHVEEAEEWGGLALGGDLSPERLLLAYRSGIFPWYDIGQPIIWHAPDPRFVMFPKKLKVAKSMRPIFNQKKFGVTFDTDFSSVIRNCQQTRRSGQIGTWITDEMLEAYCYLHTLGYAHSVEVWQEDRLVGGLYGVSLGSIFFGESMFSKLSNASKTGFITLAWELQKRNFSLIDSQVHTPHLESMGAEEIPRKKYMNLLRQALRQHTHKGSWTDWLE